MVNKKEIEQAITNILCAIGEEPSRKGLEETPRRVANMYEELIKIDEEPPELKVFEEEIDEIIAKSNIPYFSLCEHHIIPFFGEVHIAYLPRKKIVGLSKIARTVKYFSRRLQIQEKFTRQIGDYLYEGVSPRGLLVVVEGQHLCEQMRGAESGGTMSTSAVYGFFKEKQEVKKEALELLGVG